MAGHSKWANIKHRKGAQDKKRAKIFTKIIKEITISARLGGGDLTANPRLRKAVSNGKSNNIPFEKIERAIKKGTGELEGAIYEEVIYEGYGPGGLAILMNVITDNKNRSVADIRHILNKFNGNLGESGSVSWMFDQEGQIVLSSSTGDENNIFEVAIEAGAADFIINKDFYIVTTSSSNLMQIRDKIESYGYDIKSAEIEMVPKNFQKLNKEDSDIALKLLDALDDNDDVNKLYSNFDYI